MSDEEGAYDDEGGLDDFEPADEDDVGAAAAAEDDGYARVLLAAADDSGDEGETADEDETADEGEPGEGGDASLLAAASSARADPLLRAANRPRTARLIPPDERRTDNRLSLNEVAQIVSMRAEQIARSSTTFCETASHDPAQRALDELRARRCPLKLRRCVGATDSEIFYEEWEINEMTFPMIPMA